MRLRDSRVDAERELICGSGALQPAKVSQSLAEIDRRVGQVRIQSKRGFERSHRSIQIAPAEEGRTEHSMSPRAGGRQRYSRSCRSLSLGEVTCIHQRFAQLAQQFGIAGSSAAARRRIAPASMARPRRRSASAMFRCMRTDPG